MPMSVTMETLDVSGLGLPVEVRLFQGMTARPAPLVLHLPGGTFMATPADRASAISSA